MAQGTIEIKFVAKGNKGIQLALMNLDVATKRLKNSTSKYERELKQLGFSTRQANAFLKRQNDLSLIGVKNQRLLGNAFATLRSKMLLASFAIGVVSKGIVDLVEESAKVEALEVGFDNLGRSINMSAEGFKKLEDATDGTMSKSELFKQANNAMMLGVVKSEDEMAKLFDTAQRLGQVLGRDTANSIESIVTGMGRQSRLMLDNLGIIVKSETAYKKYADTLGLSADQLTDLQKKEAFNEEVLAISAKMVEKLGDEYLNSLSNVQRMKVATENLRVAMGEALAPVLKIISDSLITISKLLNAKRVKSYALAIGTLGAAMFALKIETLLAAASLKTLKTALLTSGYGIAILALGELINAMGIFDEKTKKTTKTITEQEEVVDELTEAQKELNQTQLDSERTLRNKILVLEMTTDKEKMLFELSKDRKNGVDDLSSSERALVDVYIRRREEIENLQIAEQAQLNGYRMFANAMMDAGATMNLLNGVSQKSLKLSEDQTIADKQLNAIRKFELSLLDENFEMTRQLTELEIEAILLSVKTREEKRKVTEEERLLINTKKELIDTIQSVAQHEINAARATADAKIAISNEIENRELEAQRNTFEYKMATDKQKAAMEKRITDKHDKQEKKAKDAANKRMKQAFMVQQALSATETIISAHQGANKATGQLGIFGISVASALLATGYASAALILAQKPPAMRYGGMVGGQRHSQGGTMIEAERGEFVMRREAVDAVGIETMNRINQGGGAGNINISFNGNVLSKDFIEDEAIPQIKEAIRRGADIGVG